MIKILDASLNRLANVVNAINAERLEEINGENTLDFTAILDSKLNNYITEDTIFELDNDYFDIAYFKKILNDDMTYTVEVESEHVSYRLNDPAYDVEYFTEIGTPTVILGKILEGTGFTIGTVSFSSTVTYSLQEAASRRQVLMEFAAYIGAELYFNKFEISLIVRRGSATVQTVIRDRNVKVLSKSVDKRKLDNNGNPTVSYTCTPIYIPTDDYELGDNILLVQNDFGIHETLRVVRVSRNPYDEMATTFEFSNYINGLADSLYRIVTDTVGKDKYYNGCRIGPIYGFEAVRNDKCARAYLRSDGLCMQSGDGTGSNWKDRLYYDYDSEADETVLVFDGKFTVDVLEALLAVVTSNLYADKGYISELTVDELETSDKVQRFLNSDVSDVNYIHIVDQVIQFVTASVISGGTASQTSSGSWTDAQTDTYYKSVEIDTDGYPVFDDGCAEPMTAFDAFGAGYRYRELDSTSYYKMIGVLTDPDSVSYEICTISLSSSPFAEKTSDGSWADAQLDMYYKYVIITPEGLPSLSDGLSMNAADAFAAGRVYRAIDNTSYYMLTGVTTEPASVTYDVYTINMNVGYTNYVQASSRNGALYWLDENFNAASNEVTDYPVYIYKYDEVVKMENSFDWDEEQNEYVPRISLGLSSQENENGTGVIYKGKTGLHIDYNSTQGDLRQILMNDAGIILTPFAAVGTSALTVDRLVTDTKIENYLNGDTSDVNYVKIIDQVIQFVTATFDTEATPNFEILLNRDNEELYWFDAEHRGITTDETPYPVKVYKYVEIVKMQNEFYYDVDKYIPRIILGAGVEENSDKGKGVITKTGDGLHLSYYDSIAEELREFRLGDDGIELTSTLLFGPSSDYDNPASKYGKGEIYKDDDGFHISYYDSVAGELREVRLGDDGIDVVSELIFGPGANEYNDDGKGKIFKDEYGLHIAYYDSTAGELREILLGDEGIIFTPELEGGGNSGGLGGTVLASASTTLSFFVEDGQAFTSPAWEHGFNTAEDTVLFFAIPQYNGGPPQSSPCFWDISVEKVSNTTARVHGWNQWIYGAISIDVLAVKVEPPTP